MTSPLATLRRAPVPLRIAAALVGIQTLGFAGFGLYELGQLVAARIVSGMAAEPLVLVAWGLALGWGAYALLGGRAVARGPVLAAQLIQVPTAWSLRGGDTTWAAVALGLTSLGVMVLVLFPASTRYLVGPRPERS
ncbi:hypothetical protein [Raineyella fluvialis]|uniref:Uncharacterized protein n=1 Tax=Raineyella fluvialis TaxID=2662261 RepID=A0A5Q2FBL3_9ACTN|nr:hypothetical protein [Raineyella fluvialis]QGF24440.1 hypothetical protein Rai3103_13145 [Raineyella fluvialis]